MIKIAACTALLAVASAGLVLAHTPEEANAAATKDIVADLERAGGKLVQLAEAIPADKYSWRPSEEVRKTSEVFMHVVGTNMLMPPGLGAPLPDGMSPPENPFAMMQEWEAKVTAKADVVAKLKESLDYAAKSLPAITDHDTEVDLFGFPATKRTYVLILLTHVHEHLGQAIAYARSMGVVPPWSQPAAGEGDGDGGK